MKSTKDYKRTVDNKMHYYGDTDLGKRAIRVNKKKSKKSGRPGEVLDTIYHEETHARHPKMYERTVRKVTKAMLPSLSKKQKQAYYRKYA